MFFLFFTCSQTVGSVLSFPWSTKLNLSSGERQNNRLIYQSINQFISKENAVTNISLQFRYNFFQSYSHLKKWLPGRKFNFPLHSSFEICDKLCQNKFQFIPWKFRAANLPIQLSRIQLFEMLFLSLRSRIPATNILKSHYKGY